MSASETTPPAPFRVGLLGHGTVGSAFAALLDERAAEIERFNGRAPVISGVLTRSRGDFAEILADADLIVEVMGGIEPAREHLLAAMAHAYEVARDAVFVLLAVVVALRPPGTLALDRRIGNAS